MYHPIDILEECGRGGDYRHLHVEIGGAIGLHCQKILSLNSSPQGYGKFKDVIGRTSTHPREADFKKLEETTLLFIGKR